MPSLSAVTLAALLIASALLGAFATYYVMRGQVVEIVEKDAPSISHDDGSLTAARVTREKPAKPAPTKPAGRNLRTVEVDVLPEPVVCPSTGETIQCKPVGLRIDFTEVQDGIRASVAAQNGEILDAADYAIAPWAKLAARKNLLQVQAFTDGTKSASYSRKVLGRLWVGPALLSPSGQPAVAGVALGLEF